MQIKYNCLSEIYKQPFGCVTQHQLCHMMVEVSSDCPVGRLEVVLEGQTGYGMRVSFLPEGAADGFMQYRTEFSLPRHDLYFYHFSADGRDWFRAGDEGTAPDVGEPWQLTCCPADFQVPEEFCGGVLYQIFPDRFFKGRDCDLSHKLEPYWVHDHWDDTPAFRPNEHGEILNNDFFGGNLDGIRQKLGYLKSLSVGVLYLNPICMAFSNHRYDTADYHRIDPMLGTDEDFSALCREAHALDMKVVLDGVYSHTGSNSVYFDRWGAFGGGAYSDPNSPYRSWYDFQQYPDQYTCWWNIPTLPCVNEMNPAYLDYLIRREDSVVAHWLALGADGFRLDVADELPDAFIAAFRARVKELKPDALLVGEVWEDASNKIAYGVRRRYFSDGELDSVMNYPFRNAILSFLANGDAQAFRSAVMEIVEHYPAPVLHCLMNSLSTHDTPRVLTLMGGDFDGTKEEKANRRLSPEQLASAVAREMAAAVLQFTLPGMASIYYGDEAGMEGFEDPFNRRCFPWGRERAELLEFYRALAGLKATLPPLRRGAICFEPGTDKAICFTRTLNGQRVRAVVSAVEHSQPLPKNAVVLLLRHGRQEPERLVLEPWGCAMILEEEFV